VSAPDPAAAPAHPGADFDGCEEAPAIPAFPAPSGLFVITDGGVVEADCVDVPIVGEVDEGGVVRWAGGGR